MSLMVLSESPRARIAILPLLYVASSLPIGLFYGGIIPWSSAAGPSASEVAQILAMLSLPFGLKIAGAAIMDRYTLQTLGRRRPWIIGSCFVISCSLLLAAWLNPQPENYRLLAGLAFVVSLGCATLDSAVDGLAVNILEANERGMASAWMYGAQAGGLAVGAAAGSYLLGSAGYVTTFVAFFVLSLPFAVAAVAFRERPGDRFFSIGRAGSVAETSTEVVGQWRELTKLLFHAITRKDSLIILAAGMVGGIVLGIFNAFWPIFGTKELGIPADEFGRVVGILIAVAAVVSIPVGAGMIKRFQPAGASISVYAFFAILAAVLIAANGQLSFSIFIGLTTVWILSDLLTSICINPLRLTVSHEGVGATQFSAYTSAANLAKSLGVLLFGFAYDAQMRTEILVGAIALTGIVAYLLSTLRKPSVP